MENKVLSYLGFAAKARKLVTGYNTCIYMMEKKKIRLLVLAEDLSENSVKKMVSLAARHNIPYIVYGTKEVLSHRTGNVEAGIFGVTDENLAAAISREIDHRKS